MANDIKQKIVLEGEKEYNKALSDAKRNLKTLRSELKAETAELGANATAQQKNETRIKSLQKQIKEQEKIVKTYQSALKEVKEKYSDNEDAIAKWEQKLNDARTSLANMKNELDGVGKSFKDVQSSADMATVASKSVADTLGKLSDVGGAISDGIEGVFNTLLNTAKETITEIWGDIVDLAARSNNLVDLAGFWNTDVTTIQKYAGAVEEVSGHLEDLNSVVTKINAGDAKKITELTGVSAANYSDQWEYAMAVMDAMSKMSTENRNKVAFDIFGGRQATKAFDLLNDWDNLIAHLEKYDANKSGYGLSEEQFKTMSELYDKVNGLKQSWQSLKDMATVRLFGDVSIQMTGNAQAVMDALLKYMNAGSQQERDEALAEIETNITAMFETAATAIQDGIAILDKVAENLENSDNPAAKSLGKVLKGLVEVLEWFTEDNMTHVVSALEILAGFWVAGKGLKMATTIAELAANIRTLSFARLMMGGGAESLFSGATGGITVDAVTSAITASSGSIATAIANALTSTGGVIGVGIMMMAPVVARLFGGKDKEVQEYEKKLNEAAGTTEAAEKIENAFNNGYEALHRIFGDNTNKKEVLGGNVDTSGFTLPTKKTPQGTLVGYKLTDEQRQGLEDYWDYSRGDDAWKELEQEQKLNTLFSDNMDTLNKLMDMITILQTRDGWTTLEDLPAEWWQHQGGNSGNTDGITSEDAKSMTGAVQQMPKAVAKALSGLSVRMDGQTVGYIVAPYVSQQIASQIGG